jgi:hypothetical protein
MVEEEVRAVVGQCVAEALAMGTFPQRTELRIPVDKSKLCLSDLWPEQVFSEVLFAFAPDHTITDRDGLNQAVKGQTLMRGRTITAEEFDRMIAAAPRFGRMTRRRGSGCCVGTGFRACGWAKP